jgi:hypothetical protein
MIVSAKLTGVARTSISTSPAFGTGGSTSSSLRPSISSQVRQTSARMPFASVTNPAELSPSSLS